LKWFGKHDAADRVAPTIFWLHASRTLVKYHLSLPQEA
jgi:hypothetical protein